MTLNDGKGKETAVILRQLRQLLTQQFNMSELQHLSFDLGIEYEDLAGSTRSDKVVSLIEYLQRNGRLTDLITQRHQLRPRTAWPDFIAIRTLPNSPGNKQPILPVQDSFSRYEAGFNILQSSLGQSHTSYADFLIYKHRLIENITQTRRYGDTENRRADRSEIIDRLNSLSLSTIGFSFTQLCS